jgi:RPA family protein
MENQPVRQVAYKVWISDIVNNEFIKEEGEWEPNYLTIQDKKVSRVNIIANVITNYKNDEGDYVSVTIDDGSNSIQVKAWKEDISILTGLEIGETILLIARVREYNNEKYLTPEIVKKLDKPEWLVYRKKELEKVYGSLVVKTEPIKEELNEGAPVEEEVVSSSNEDGNRQKILNIIETLATEEGADKLDIIKDSELNDQTAEGIIQSLLMEGEIFELKPGKIKILG